MMKIYIILTALSITLLSFGQQVANQREELLFEKAILLQTLAFENLDLEPETDSTSCSNIKSQYAKEIKLEILARALENYEELIDSFPDSKLLFRALNNKGFIEMDLRYYKSAKKTFLKILNSDANDKERDGAGKGLMAEPFANYKNTAAKMLAEISLKENNYTDAIHYLAETKNFSYRHFCGNAYAADKIYIATLYGKCYSGLKDYKKAAEILLPHLIENGLADNSKLVALTHEILLQSYSKEELKIKFENAFKNYYSEEKKVGDKKFTNYYIDFLGIKLELDSWWSFFDKPGEIEKAVKDVCKVSRFYHLLIK